MAKIVAIVSAITGMTDETHVQGSANFWDVDNGWSSCNWSISIGLTLAAANLAIAADVANAANDQFSTSRLSTQVMVFAGPSLLAT